MPPMNERDEALYFFRKLVYVLYREVGSLTPKIHPEMANKADMKNAFFEREKDRYSAEFYLQTEQETEPAKILSPYIERTRLTLEDVQRVFAEGDWRNKYGGYTSGGPRWAHIAGLTLQLREQIEQEDWDQAAGLVYEIKKLKTNHGYLVNQFERTERRR